MDNYVTLAQAALAWTGVLAVFVVFQLQRFDRFVDNRKRLLLTLLAKQVQKDAALADSIQNHGKKAFDESRHVIKKAATGHQRSAVKSLLKQIERVRDRRTELVCHTRILGAATGLVAIVSMVVAHFELAGQELATGLLIVFLLALGLSLVMISDVLRHSRDA
ncbi:MAG: hypothetical protein KDK35_21690 [Leptospiraceae bacterium]|nr:hypothetical protein [Leptospiraceae bacterium]